jgi:hypothetical protein
VTDHYPSAPGSPEQSPWAPPAHHQRSESDATVHQPGTAHDPWNRDGVTTPAPGPGYQPYPQPTAYEQQPYNAPAGPAAQPYGAQPYGAQPYGAQPYGAQPYGTQPYYGSQQPGSPEQPGYPQPTAYDPAGGFPPFDQNISYSTLGPVEPAPKPRGRRRALVLSISTVVLLLLGVGAYAAVRAWTGAGNAEPETAMPASVGAFARIDFNPGVRDKLAFDDLVKKFPTNGKSTSDLITSLETQAAAALNLDYTTDVKPWFDGRIGVAEWTDHQGKPIGLIDLASKDDTAAKATLAKLQAQQGAGTFGYVVQDGYVLIATGGQQNAQAEAEDAAAEAKTSSLSDSSAFKSASGHLKGNNLVILYADLHSLGQLLSSQVSSLDGAGSSFGQFGIGGLLGGSGSTSLSDLSGTIIVGASVVDDGVEIRAHAEGSSLLAGTGNGTTDARAALDALPETTIAGLSFDGLDPNSASAKSLSQSLDGLLGQAFGGGSANTQAISRAATTLLTSKVLTIALTGLSNGLPSLLVSADTRDASGAAAIKQTVDQLLQGENVPGLQVTQDGTHIQATFGNAGSGHLGDDALYKETMSGMNHVQQALYLNVQKLVSAAADSLGPGVLSDIGPIKAIGLSDSGSASGSDTLIRIVIK